jgi:D-alanine-D-alanine ligase
VVTLPEDMQLADRLRREAVHMAWLNTGGVQGYNPMAHAAAMLEMLGVPYVGHDPLTAGTLDNKHVLKRDVALLGIPTAPFMVWHLARGPFVAATNRRFLESFRGCRGPFVVKPVSGRASLHVRVVDDAAGLTEAVAEVYGATENHVLIEEYLPGREFCVAVCGPVTAHGGRLERQRGPFVFAAVERLLGAGERIFTSMDVRPITADRVRPLDPAEDAGVLAELHRLAREVFVELGIETLIRLDVRADATGRMFVLEANPKPDLQAPTPDRTSLICAGLAPHGMSYDDLVLSLVADRLDLLFSQRRGTVSHLTALLA